jgi:methylated-DNA-[protein]-cysteine S-methyltransferase
MLAGTLQGIQQIVFNSKKQPQQPETHWENNPKPFSQACKQLDEYFEGTRQNFTLKLAPTGTQFQQSVWQQLRKIPYGNTCSYGDIASALDNPKASRAVGAANGANPLPIVIPCHRVIGANGSLTGFSGGLAVKDWLLAHERGEPMLFSFNELKR